jgi:prepilin-type processing-associated H-X9-DG protein
VGQRSLPPPPPSNAPALTGVTLTGTTAHVQFENVPNEAAHGVKISTNLLAGFDDYGLRATMGTTNDGVRLWSAAIPEISATKEYYAPYAGLEPAQTPTYWTPNANIPIGATTVRVYFCQFQSNLKGDRSMTLTGTFRSPEWDTGQPMAFMGDGTWWTDVVLPAGTSGSGVKFKPRGGPAYDWLTGGDFQFVRGSGGVTMAPLPPVPGELFTITLDAAGTPLAAAADIRLHMGFDNWQDVQESPRPAMTNMSGTWEYAFVVPTNYSSSIDWVFTDATGIHLVQLRQLARLHGALLQHPLTPHTQEYPHAKEKRLHPHRAPGGHRHHRHPRRHHRARLLQGHRNGPARLLRQQPQSPRRGLHLLRRRVPGRDAPYPPPPSCQWGFSEVPDFSAIAVKVYTNGFVTDLRLWVCPSDKTDGNNTGVSVARDIGSFRSQFGNCSYMYISGYHLMRTTETPAVAPMLCDESNAREYGPATPGSMPVIGPDDNHGASIRNVLFLDGHVVSLKNADAANAIFNNLKNSAVICSVD